MNISWKLLSERAATKLNSMLLVCKDDLRLRPYTEHSRLDIHRHPNLVPWSVVRCHVIPSTGKAILPAIKSYTRDVEGRPE